MPTCRLSPRVARLLDEDAGCEELEGHLASCPLCQRALDEAAGPLRLPPPEPTGDDPPAGLLDRLRGLPNDPPDEPPPEIPGFEVLEVLGRGGSAVVYKARQVALNRTVALKVLSRDHAARPDALARARRGVEALAAMEHPGIVRVLHAGLHEGVYYSVQEYADGGSLAGRLNGVPWPAADAVRLVKQLADAVQALHEHGFLHRDLKPANVLLSANGAPRLADFGLVRPIDDAEQLTGSGYVVGTPGAMAPEQAEGRRLGPAADVWGMGVILYELLTGRPPFVAEETTELLGRAAGDAPEPPGRLAAGVPAALERICLGCLRKDPRVRYPTAAALAADLQGFLGKPTGLGPWFLRRPGLLSGLIVLAVALGLAAVFVAADLKRQRDQTEQTLHHLRLDLARERLERGDRAGAWMALERCPAERRDEQWQQLWRRCQPPGE